MAATQAKAAGTEAIYAYLNAYMALESANSTMSDREAQEQEQVVAMAGDQNINASKALSGINQAIIDGQATEISRLQAVLNNAEQPVIDFFDGIRATQQQGSYIGYIIVPELNKKITAQSGVIDVQDIN